MDGRDRARHEYLVYARREEAPFHKEATKILRDLAEGDQHWALPWPCIYESLRVVTHPCVFDPPTNLESALDDLESLLDSSSLVLLGEGRPLIYFD
jgi:predicted nucleic acid-binding protein